jgi:hypothetical protein
MEVKMLIAFDKGQGNGGVKKSKLKAEGKKKRR